MAAKKNDAKKCEALKFAKSVKNSAILAKCATVWKERNVNADGSLKKNRWAPIYVVRGDGETAEKMSVRLTGDKLILSGEIASCDCPKPKLVW